MYTYIHPNPLSGLVFSRAGRPSVFRLVVLVLLVFLSVLHLNIPIDITRYSLNSFFFTSYCIYTTFRFTNNF